MAKVKLDYMSLSMRAEGSDDMVRELSGRFLDMADKYAAPGFYFPALPPSVFEDGCRDPEELNTGDMKPLTTPKEVAPGADWDVVAIYDDAGIPSIMHRFRRMSNKELFGGTLRRYGGCPRRLRCTVPPRRRWDQQTPARQAADRLSCGRSFRC